MNLGLAENGFPQLSLQGELWREVPNSEGRYFVSNLGRLLSTCHRGKGLTALMKPAADANGYRRTVFFINGRYSTVKVHRVVAEVWVAERPLTPADHVNHRNFQRSDNRADNLEILSHRDNVRYSAQRGRYGKSTGSINGNSKLTEDQVRAIKREYAPYVMTQRMLAQRYGVATITIKHILRGRSWRGVV